MNLIKKHLCNLPNCYATSCIEVNGKNKYFFATDDYGPCVCIDAQTGEQQNVWDLPGGTMSIVPLKNTDGEFLASQNFFPGFKAKNSAIVRARFENGRWDINSWMALPYLHRFDLVTIGEDIWFIGCVLSSTENESAEFDKPGNIVVGKLKDNYSAPLELKIIADGMSRNHGYCKITNNALDEIYTCCDQGVFKLNPPSEGSLNWSVKKILDMPASDIAVCDIDNDGHLELGVIKDFHGSDFIIFHQDDDGIYTEASRYPQKIEFLHAIWGGELCGKNRFLCGGRALNKELFCVSYENSSYNYRKIEQGYGASNVHVFDENGTQKILVANREAGECAVFSASAF